jgi:riboflavin synthase
VGCSICVSGVCLTATELEMDRIFKVGLARNLDVRTYLGSLQAGDAVNLERYERNWRTQFWAFYCKDTWMEWAKLLTGGPDSLFKIRVTPDMLKYTVPKALLP